MKQNGKLVYLLALLALLQGRDLFWNGTNKLDAENEVVEKKPEEHAIVVYNSVYGKRVFHFNKECPICQSHFDEVKLGDIDTLRGFEVKAAHFFARHPQAVKVGHAAISPQPQGDLLQVRFME